MSLYEPLVESWTYPAVSKKVADIHPTAKMHPTAVIWAFAQIMADVQIGEGVSIASGVYVGRNTVIGARSRIGQGSHITDHMTIGEDVFIGPHVVFINDKYPVANNPNYTITPPVVENHVSIGGGATILPGVRLGEGCMVGAGAVVTKDVMPYTVVVGNPATYLREAAAGPTGAKEPTT